MGTLGRVKGLIQSVFARTAPTRMTGGSDYVMKRLLPALVIGMSTLLTATASPLEDQREIFLEAYKAAASGRAQAALGQWSALDGYTLKPYLEYQDLIRHLSRRSDTEIRSFIEREADTAIGERLRTIWLTRLAKQGHSARFIEIYTPQDSESLRCYYLSARAAAGTPDPDLLQAIRAAWLSGDSVDAACDPAFEVLYASPLMGDALLWERVELAMAARQTRLASYLARRLKDPEFKTLFARWETLHSNPLALRADTTLPDQARARTVLVEVIARRAGRDLNGTLLLWPRLRERFAFSQDELFRVGRTLALTADRRDHPEALRLLAELPPERLDRPLEHALLTRALEARDWPLVLKLTAQSPRAPEHRYRWQYWQARALESTGMPERAEQAYARLAEVRDYYGFIAADRIDAPYHFNHLPVASSAEEVQTLTARPGIARCLELFSVELDIEARREWWFEVRQLSPRELEVLAEALFNIGEHHQAIMTLGRARSYDDLDIRFPLLHRAEVDRYAARRSLPPATLYAVIRTESAFLPDARSGAGARGLMQLMPRTAQDTARRINLRYRGPHQLNDPDINIMLGSAYLRDMLGQFDDNLALAAAAYNAGPHRARAWRPQATCVPLDEWVEQIPFSETRSYVRRMLFHAVVYQHRMGLPPLRVSQLAGGITNKGSSARC